MRTSGLRVLVAVTVALVVAAGVSTWRTQRSAPPFSLPLPIFQPQPLVTPDPLDGLAVSAAMAHRRPIGVIVDNHPKARPQWGLSAASRIYEAITEGGITRYLAVYGPRDAERIGPVRSVRTQFVNYASELSVSLAHVGGNEDALALIDRLHLDDVNQFQYPEAYRRFLRPGVSFEHTVYTSTEALRGLGDRNGGGEVVSLDSPRWKDDLPPAQRPAAQQITVAFSTALYRVTWVYQPALNDYQRMLAGVPDVDAGTGSPLAAKVIAIAVVARAHGRTWIGEDTWTFSDLGSGRAWVIQDGTVVEGSWRKDSATDRLRFFDESGVEIAFDRGPEWIEIIPPEVTPGFE